MFIWIRWQIRYWWVRLLPTIIEFLRESKITLLVLLGFINGVLAVLVVITFYVTMTHAIIIAR